MRIPPSEYLDFEIRIWREGPHYFAQAESSQESSERVSLDPLFESPKDAQILMLRLENALLRQGARASVEEKALKDFGQEVFDTIFRNSHSIYSLYTQCQAAAEADEGVAGLRVRLRIDAPDLAQFPWEYLYNSGSREWLGLFYKSPIIRRLDVLNPTPPLKLDGPLNILGMIANPGTKKWKLLEDAERERTLIDRAIQPHQAAGKVNFRWTQAGTSDALRSMMSAEHWHVFHFIGHGGMPSLIDEEPEGGIPADEVDEHGHTNEEEGDAADRPEGFIVLSDGRGGHNEVAASELKTMLQQPGRSSLRLVFLNCCESARGTAEDVFASPAAALVRAGIPNVIAMQFPITGDAAIELSSAFYENLADGWPIEAALTTARNKMWDKSRIDWGIPVLYTRAKSGQLFVSTSRPSRQADAHMPDQPVDQRKQQARARLRELYRV